MIVVTGAAGFIGSCIVAALNHRGRNDICIVDNILETEKCLNLRNKRYLSYIQKANFGKVLNEIGETEAIIHMEDCPAAAKQDFNELYRNNFEYTKELWNYCAEKHIPFIYMSSAAAYGDGNFEDTGDIDRLQPFNACDYSRYLFDLWVKQRAAVFPKQHVGLKLFHVYGPNEYHKGNMASMVFHGYNQIKSDGEIRLFKSENPEYAGGAQCRDFVYVKDVCEVILWMLDHPEVNGLFHVGTGRKRSFRELAEAVFQALELEPNIRYIDMPEHLKETYQYCTKADIKKLRDVGCDRPFMDIETGVKDYVQNYLNKGYGIF